jgi:tetraacyldisaccharide 4'-kinase
VAFRDWLEQSLLAIWFGKPRGAAILLVPLLGVASLGSLLPILKKSRLQAVRKGNSSAPKVIVVGNLVVGGGGKTPVVAALAQALSKHGLKVGILCSGYGSDSYESARVVDSTAHASEVGDEALMLSISTRLPVAVGRDRVASKALLLNAHPELDVLICDDGLQNLELIRDIEIVVFDERLSGNNKLLPLGPLREPLSRLKSVDFIIAHKAAIEIGIFAKEPGAIFEHGWKLAGFIPLVAYAKRIQPLQLVEPYIFSATYTGHVLQAVAGIANPEKFLNTLTGIGLKVVLHKPGDHQALSDRTIHDLANLTLVMTEKDAVKYLSNTRAPALTNAWVAIAENVLPTKLIDNILTLLKA